MGSEGGNNLIQVKLSGVWRTKPLRLCHWLSTAWDFDFWVTPWQLVWFPFGLVSRTNFSRSGFLMLDFKGSEVYMKFKYKKSVRWTWLRQMNKLYLKRYCFFVLLLKCGVCLLCVFSNRKSHKSVARTHCHLQSAVWICCGDLLLLDAYLSSYLFSFFISML